MAAPLAYWPLGNLQKAHTDDRRTIISLYQSKFEIFDKDVITIKRQLESALKTSDQVRHVVPCKYSAKDFQGACLAFDTDTQTFCLKVPLESRVEIRAIFNLIFKRLCKKLSADAEADYGAGDAIILEALKKTNTSHDTRNFSRGRAVKKPEPKVVKLPSPKYIRPEGKSSEPVFVFNLDQKKKFASIRTTSPTRIDWSLAMRPKQQSRDESDQANSITASKDGAGNELIDI